MAMKPYVVRQGDYLLKIAHTLGFDAEKAWSDPKNADLKKLRRDHSMLRPGDILFIPDEPKKKLSVNLKQSNTYVARVPSVKVCVAVLEDDEPLKNEKYVLEGLGDETERTTDDKGQISFEAPVHIKEVTAKFVDRDLKLNIAIGALDPADTPSGARMRLTSLGYYAARVEGSERYVAHDEDSLKGAIKAFQKANSLSPTGELDSETRDTLVSIHGS